MVDIQIISDLHLESPKAYDVFEIVPRAPYLALLGDIGNIGPHRDQCLEFLARQLERFQAVLFVPGNHEAYGSSWGETLGILRQFERDVRMQQADRDGLGEFVLLDRGIYHIPDGAGGGRGGRGGITILGCSLFSHVPVERAMDVEIGLQDFFQTAEWDVKAHNEAHARDLSWLNDEVRKIEGGDGNEKVVILTHWSPSLDGRALDPKHAASRITSGFVTDLSTQPCYTSDRVVLWAFGHTHHNCDFVVERRNSGRGGDAGSLRLLTNQRGYYFAQAGGFDAEKTVELV